MTFTRAIGVACNKIIVLIVRGLALARIHPNVLTFIGLLINIWAAFLLARLASLPLTPPSTPVPDKPSPTSLKLLPITPIR